MPPETNPCGCEQRVIAIVLVRLGNRHESGTDSPLHALRHYNPVDLRQMRCDGRKKREFETTRPPAQLFAIVTKTNPIIQREWLLL